MVFAPPPSVVPNFDPLLVPEDTVFVDSPFNLLHTSQEHISRVGLLLESSTSNSIVHNVDSACANFRSSLASNVRNRQGLVLTPPPLPPSLPSNDLDPDVHDPVLHMPGAWTLGRRSNNSTLLSLSSPIPPTPLSPLRPHNSSGLGQYPGSTRPPTLLHHEQVHLSRPPITITSTSTIQLQPSILQVPALSHLSTTTSNLHAHTGSILHSTLFEASSSSTSGAVQGSSGVDSLSVCRADIDPLLSEGGSALVETLSQRDAPPPSELLSSSSFSSSPSSSSSASSSSHSHNHLVSSSLTASICMPVSMHCVNLEFVGRDRGCAPSVDTARRPRLSAISIALWNCRALIKSDPIRRICSIPILHNLCTSHTFVCLTETNLSVPKVVSSQIHFPNSHMHFFAHSPSHSGGVSLSVSQSFLSSCTFFNAVSLDADGHAIIFYSDCPQGALDVITVYMDTHSPHKRARVLRNIRAHIRTHAHTIFCGDFNFVCIPEDRITFSSNHTKHTQGIDVTTFNRLFSTFTEFEQSQFTCRNAHGLSRIDRIYDSLPTALICTMGTACNTIQVDSTNSDHNIVSCKFFELEHTPSISPHIIARGEFTSYLVEELHAQGINTQLTSTELQLSLPTDPHQLLQIFQDALFTATKITKHEIKFQPPTTTRERLIITGSFIKQLRLNNLQPCRHLQLKYTPLNNVPLDNWYNTPQYNQLLSHFHDLHQQDILDITKHEQPNDDTTDHDDTHDTLEFGNNRSAYNRLFRLRPGGSNSISALQYTLTHNAHNTHTHSLFTHTHNKLKAHPHLRPPAPPPPTTPLTHIKWQIFFLINGHPLFLVLARMSFLPQMIFSLPFSILPIFLFLVSLPPWTIFVLSFSALVTLVSVRTASPTLHTNR